MSSRKKGIAKRGSATHVVLTVKGASAKAPPGDVVGVTALAGMCGVSELTIRRWWGAGKIPSPRRFMQSLFWPSDQAVGIARTGPGPSGTYTPTLAARGPVAMSDPARKRGCIRKGKGVPK